MKHFLIIISLVFGSHILWFAKIQHNISFSDSIVLSNSAHDRVETSYKRITDNVIIEFNNRSSECITSIGSIYGSSNSNEEGKCLVETAENDGFYIAGSRNDSVLLLKVKL